MSSRTVLISLLAPVLLALGACTTPPVTPQELLDRDTGATVTVVSSPFLFIRTTRDEGSRHDYVTVAAVDVNRNSQHEQLLLAYFWSTTLESAPSAPEPLRLVLDGETLALSPDPRSARDAGIASGPHKPPGGFASDAVVYRCDPATWRRIASARQITLARGSGEAQGSSYEIWTDGRPALLQMLAAMPP